jgi:hypothetical protein
MLEDKDAQGLSLKEWLGRIEKRIDGIDAKLWLAASGGWIAAGAVFMALHKW